MRRHLFAFVLLSLAPCLVLATDGVIEINQAKVLAGGGFPYTIASAGSYRLTSDLLVTAAPDPPNTTAILITAPGVTLDLNGFSIRGPITCTQIPASCNGAGTGNGIRAQLGGVFDGNLTVRNGNVRGMGGIGVYIEGAGGNFEDLEVTHCAGGGLSLSGVARGIQAHLNAAFGIFLFGGSLTGSVSTNNFGPGIIAGVASVVGNTAYQNQGKGIQADRSVVRDNVCVANTAAALDLANAAWVGNLLAQCPELGCVSGSGVQLGANSCEGALCPP